MAAAADGHGQRHAGHHLPAGSVADIGLPAADHLRSAAHLVANLPAGPAATDGHADHPAAHDWADHHPARRRADDHPAQCDTDIRSHRLPVHG